MSAAALAAVITAAAGLVTAVTALIHSIRTRAAVNAPTSTSPSSATSSARSAPPAGSGHQ